MHTYIKLKDGSLWILSSDNTEEETVHCYPINQEQDWDPEWDTCECFPYSDILVTDCNRSYIENYTG